MKMKHIAFLSVSLLMSVQAMGVQTSENYGTWWGYGRAENGGYGDFILAGGVGNDSAYQGVDNETGYPDYNQDKCNTGKSKHADRCVGGGNRDGERAIIAVIAREIVEHGGYFCPTQIQCGQKRNYWHTDLNQTSYTLYYNPSGFSESKCVWLCEPGYFGKGCKPQGYNPVANVSKTEVNTKGYFSGVSLNKQLASKTTNIETTIFAFDVWNHNKKYEADTVLGLYQFGVHGAHAAPIAVYCTHNGKIKTEKPVTYVQKIAKMTGKDSLLCASGYIPDATKTDCVADNTNYDIDPETGETFVEKTPWCDGFPGTQYDMEKHYREEGNGCIKYFCSEQGYAFPRSGVAICEPCTADKKSGIHPNTGVCVHCETGTVFDKETGNCVSAVQISKWDMMYGCGKTRSDYDKDLVGQCWTKGSPDELIACVRYTGSKCAIGETPRGNQTDSRTNETNTDEKDTNNAQCAVTSFCASSTMSNPGDLLIEGQSGRKIPNENASGNQCYCRVGDRFLLGAHIYPSESPSTNKDTWLLGKCSVLCPEVCGRQRYMDLLCK